MTVARVVGLLYGILSGAFAYLLFGFHLWQSIATAGLSVRYFLS
jgi:hypothetical protein